MRARRYPVTLITHFFSVFSSLWPSHPFIYAICLLKMFVHLLCIGSMEHALLMQLVDSDILCSSRSGNLRHLQIVLRNLRSVRLLRDLWTVRYTAQSRLDCFGFTIVFLLNLNLY